MRIAGIGEVNMRVHQKLVSISRRVRMRDDEGRGVDRPGEFVEDGGEGVGDWDIVVDEAAFFVAAAFGDTPTHGAGRADEDL
jgi:hypothetical protein